MPINLAGINSLMFIFTEESVKRVRSSNRFRCGGLGIRFDSLAIKSNDTRVEKAAQFSVPRNG